MSLLRLSVSQSVKYLFHQNIKLVSLKTIHGTRIERFQPPTQLNLSGNAADNWKRFQQQFVLYLEAVDKSAASDKTKNAILLTIAGGEAPDIYNTFVFARQRGYQTCFTTAEIWCSLQSFKERDLWKIYLPSYSSKTIGTCRSFYHRFENQGKGL